MLYDGLSELGKLLSLALPLAAMLGFAALVLRAGSGAVVSRMVFGNLGAGSFAGTAITRDPDDGTPRIAGGCVENALGPDLHRARRTVLALSKTAGLGDSLERRAPEVFRALADAARRLERARRAPLAIDFVIEEGKLWLLGASRAILSARASAEGEQIGLVAGEGAVAGI